MTKIIDAHTHYIPPQIAENTLFYKAGWSDISRQLAVMDELGIAQSVLLYPTSSAHQKIGWPRLAQVFNDAIDEVVRTHGERFIGGCMMPFGDKAVLQAELKNFSNRNLQVITLASSYDGTYLDDEYFFDIYAFAQDHNIPVHIHPQIMNPIGEERLKDPLLSPVLEYVFDVSVCLGRMMMNETFLRFPEVKFIFAHYGGVLPFVKERFDNTYRMLRKRGFVKDLYKLPGEYFQNLYFDVSGSKSPGALQCALEMTDANHILWGSDFPANQDMSGALRTIQDAPLAAEAKTAVLSGNAGALFSAKTLTP